MKVIFHWGLLVTKRGVSHEGDLSSGAQGNQEGCLVRLIFHYGFKRGVSHEGGLSSGSR